MIKYQHTPGPWLFGHSVRHEPTVRPGGQHNGGFVICQTFGTGKHANARLIAAAPELLEACQTFAKLLEADEVGLEEMVVKQVRAAIEKATGEQL